LDETTTERQKSFIYKKVFNEALREGMSKYCHREVDGGIKNGGREIFGMEDNVWYSNEQTNEMWLYKWGKVPKKITMKAHCQSMGYVTRKRQHSGNDL
jgi:hypothetical protein